MKIVTVLGARPQFIKAATVSRALAKDRTVKEVIIHTGQHYDANMSDIFFDEMQIPKPDYFLSIVSKHHGEMTGRMLEQIEKVLLHEVPDLVLVYGDTNSTLAGALAASKLHIPIAHVEAGLRSFNRKMPEEVNRILTDQISQWLFSPTDSGVYNLRKEGVDESKIHRVGDVMYDANLFYQQVAESSSTITEDLQLAPDSYVLATIHRAENTNSAQRLAVIFDEFSRLAQEKTIVFPLHPRTRSLMKAETRNPKFKLIDPVGYFDMIKLQKNCRLIITDSGGVQKEAYFNNKYCITVRDETEWIELVQHGFNFLSKPEDITKNAVRLWDKPFESGPSRLYGNGCSAEDIVEILKKDCNGLLPLA
jgi:UDP-GlcNAc3NAcA epimerase